MLQISSQSRILVLAVHPDDEVLSAGGLIQRCLGYGGAVSVLFVTNGESNPWPQRYLEKRISIGAEEKKRWAEKRRQEAVASTRVLGVPDDCVYFLNFPDQGLTRLALHGGKDVVYEISKHIDRFSPSHIVLPSLHDTHPDHGSLHLMLHECGMLQKLLGRTIQMLSYVLHPAQFEYGDTADGIVLTDSEMDRKKESIVCHQTQMILSKKRFLGYATKDEVFFINDLPKSQLILTRSDDGWLSASFPIKPFWRYLYGLQLHLLLSHYYSFSGIEVPLTQGRHDVDIPFRSSGYVDVSLTKIEVHLKLVYLDSKLYCKISQPPIVFDYIPWTSLVLPH